MQPLTHLPFSDKRTGPVVLCIMDGVAYGKRPEGDAVAAAYTPTLDALHESSLNVRLKAHGSAVGMPSEDDMGNSEVGHNAIGAGRVFAQGAKLVNQAIASGRLFEGETWKAVMSQAQGSTLHLIGLLSDGNVHAHIDHWKAFVRRAAADGVEKIRLHTLLDGRDVGETSALEYIEPIEAVLAELNAAGADCRIASGGGRMFLTMDRYDADWSMVQRGWDTHVHGQGRQFSSVSEAITTLRKETGAIDQDLGAFVIGEDGEPVGAIQDGDAVVMMNFRGDRAIELTKAFEFDELDKIDRGVRPDVLYAGMMSYDSDQGLPEKFLVDPPELDRTIGEYLATTGVRQFAISETQKFGHVTYFFNGNRSDKFDEALETYVEVPSDRLPFEQRPWMKAAEITDLVIEQLRSREGRYFMRINMPNGDMVGHTGNFLAAQISVEAVDLCLARLLPEVEAAGGVLIVTADHGNADEMYEFDKKTGEVKVENGKRKAKTSHTLNPVPCLIFDPAYEGEYELASLDTPGISSLTATCLNLLGFAAPEDYDPSLIQFK
ncbi:MAG TPA: 2,3-bisphosphoglycerate-independent phosphoglycerate mutase [Lentisphaeria bacterium]|nr:2,3-bisphosphoglycerate-independent phosphoglycerate mutase [Lentisphaeria bacterium]